MATSKLMARHNEWHFGAVFAALFLARVALCLTLTGEAYGQEAPAANPIHVDIALYRGGPIKVKTQDASLDVTWKDADALQWSAKFSLDRTKPLINAMRSAGETVFELSTTSLFGVGGKAQGRLECVL